MFPHTLTLYHKDATADKWTRSVVEHVLWDDLRARVMRTNGTESADRAVVYIPMVVDGVAREIPITDGDIIVKGVYDKEIVRSTKEISGLFVTGVATYDFGGELASWVVTAR